MSVRQAAFTRAMLDADRAVPAGLRDPAGRPAGRRFNVYRNNVAVSLSEALAEGFPTVQKLVGTEFFTAMARVYVQGNPPASPLMMQFGAAFPAFLEGFEPAASLPYLPDVARLELALRRAYHAGDATPIDPADLQELSPERLMATRLRLAPAVAVLRSPWPVHAIWAYNSQPDAPAPQSGPEDVLITRPGFDPVPHRLAPGGAEFVTALLNGATFGAALAATGREDFDLAGTLGQLISGGAVIRLEEGPIE